MIVWVTDFSYLGSICALLIFFFFIFYYLFIYFLPQQTDVVWVYLEAEGIVLGLSSEENISKEGRRDVGKEETYVK